jgi:phenylalanyl-tRNA synthetase alpha chain
MTEALYLSDSYQTSANAKITEVGSDYLILDQTIFYPQGGGQPSDKGHLKSETGELNLKSVEYNNGQIKHHGPITGQFKIGQKVTLTLDWTLRLKHMQWHTAGHLVDLAARELYPSLIPIKGMHGIGKKLYIEYEGIAEINLDDLNRTLSQLLKSNPSIKTEFVTLEQLKKMSNWLPAKLPTSKKLRVLSIGNSYHIPDGGTQLKDLSDIWNIEITSIETTENSTLIHYVVSQPKTIKDHKVKEIPVNSLNKNNLEKEVNLLRNRFSTDLNTVASEGDLDKLYLKYLGKKGETTKLLQLLPTLSPEDKRHFGPLLNLLKSDQDLRIKERSKDLLAYNTHELDLTVPGITKPTGHLHPTTVIIREMNEFFRYQGFSIGEGPEIEDVEYNFRRLNLPEGHPATDLQDTLFIEEPNLLLRTHTSSVETRTLSDNKPPMRVVVPGKCYRNETTSLTNSAFFFQYQGFVVDKGITMGHLKDTLTKFHQFLFGHDVKLRFRYKYYPEVSPGMGVDMECRFCHGSGCQVCKYRGFIEVLGSGMIHYNTLKACGIDPEVYSGFAFGMGLDRLVMSKYGIQDIRKLYGGEIVYL